MMLGVVSGFAPQVGCELEEKEEEIHVVGAEMLRISVGGTRMDQD